MPQAVPARVRTLDFPADVGDEFAGSRIVGAARGSDGVKITLADGRAASYVFEPSIGGGGSYTLEP